MLCAICSKMLLVGGVVAAGVFPSKFLCCTDLVMHAYSNRISHFGVLSGGM